MAGSPKTSLMVLVGIVLCAVFVLRTYVAAPQSFPVPYELVVENGDNSVEIADKLYASGAIKSPFTFRLLLRIFGTDRAVSAGHYFFPKPATVLDIALRVSGREFGINRTNVTFPEGYTVKDMAIRLTEAFPNFNAPLFIELATKEQGYLFPDTYGFLPHVSPEAVIAAMKENFERKLEPLATEIVATGRLREQIIIMASVIEKEANGEDDAPVISGILWKRFDRGLRLEVDAAPQTYTEVGLPKYPIANPGLRSIRAAIRPTASPYLYYLHDKQGAVHYASTYQEHLSNINKYLRK